MNKILIGKKYFFLSFSRRNAQSSRNSWCSLPKNVIESVNECAPNRHVAKSHDDTSEGAIHCFQDEHGMYK